MLAIKPWGRRSAEKELRSITVRSRIGHRENSGASVIENEILILEPHSVDGSPTSSITVCKISALAHEAGDNAVEKRIGEWRWSIIATIYDKYVCAELAEILSRFRNDIGAEGHLDSSDGISTNSNVKENNRVTHYII
jgi:hypothetical protein